jgi:hypothetical protein
MIKYLVYIDGDNISTIPMTDSDFLTDRYEYETDDNDELNISPKNNYYPETEWVEFEDADEGGFYRAYLPIDINRDVSSIDIDDLLRFDDTIIHIEIETTRIKLTGSCEASPDF